MFGVLMFENLILHNEHLRMFRFDENLAFHNVHNENLIFEVLAFHNVHYENLAFPSLTFLLAFG